MTNKIKFVTDERGKRISVQVPIEDWELIMKEVGNLRRDDTIQKAIAEIDDIQKGITQPVSLEEFLDEL